MDGRKIAEVVLRLMKDGEVWVLEVDCMTGEPQGPLTGRCIVMENADAVRSIFTPPDLAEQFIRQRVSTIPRNVYELLLTEIARRNAHAQAMEGHDDDKLVERLVDELKGGRLGYVH